MGARAGRKEGREETYISASASQLESYSCTDSAGASCDEGGFAFKSERRRHGWDLAGPDGKRERCLGFF
jgi:hypothetical protein